MIKKISLGSEYINILANNISSGSASNEGADTEQSKIDS
jgi:hypothetical protein